MFLMTVLVGTYLFVVFGTSPQLASIPTCQGGILGGGGAAADRHQSSAPSVGQGAVRALQSGNVNPMGGKTAQPPPMSYSGRVRSPRYDRPQQQLGGGGVRTTTTNSREAQPLARRGLTKSSSTQACCLGTSVLLFGVKAWKFWDFGHRISAP